MSEKVYYKTSDGTVFYTEDRARMHARELAEGQRAVKEVAIAEYNRSVETTEVNKVKSSVPSEYDQLKASATELGLEFKSNVSKTKLIEMIAEAKSKGSEETETIDPEGDTTNTGE